MFDQKDEAKAKEFAKRQDKNVPNRATGTAAGRKAAEARYKMEDAARMAVSGGQGGGKGKWILVALAAVLFLGVVGLVISRVADKPSAVTATAPAAETVSTEMAAVDTTEADEATTATDTVEAADETEVLEAAAAILESGEILDLTEDELLWPIALEDAEVQRKSIGGPEVHSNDYGLVAETDGTYRIWCENVAIGTTDGTGIESVYMHITDASGNVIASCSFYEDGVEIDTNQPGETITTDTGVWASSDAQGITLEGVHAGDAFLVETDAVDGTTYDLCIGKPRNIADNIAGANGHTTVDASMTYRDQSDVYTYAPSMGSTVVPKGSVRFTVIPAEPVESGEIRLDIQDSEGNYLKTYPEYGSDGSVGCTIQTTGDPYTVIVSDDSTSFDAAYAYTLDVQQVLHWQYIDEYAGVHDRLAFMEQNNVYSYTATTSGSYSIAFPELTGDWTDIGRLFVRVYSKDEYEADGMPIFGEYIDAGNSICKVDLVAGCDYIIMVLQITDYPEYTMVMVEPAE